MTFENTTGVDLADFSTSIYIADNGERPLDWRADFFTVQLRLPGSDWKSAELVDRAIRTGSHKIARGEKLTIQFRITAGTAPVGDYGGTVGGGSEAFDNTPNLPKPGSTLPNSCTQYSNYYEGGFKVADKSSSTAAATPSRRRPRRPRRAARTWPTPAPAPTRCRSPSAVPPCSRPAPGRSSCCAAAGPVRTADALTERQYEACAQPFACLARPFIASHPADAPPSEP